MEYIIASSREQTEIYSLENQIEQDNAVRFEEVFVEKLDLAQLGYVVNAIKSEGRPAFNPKVFLKYTCMDI